MYYTEKNPTIVNFPVKNLDLKDFVIPNVKYYILYIMHFVYHQLNVTFVFRLKNLLLLKI